jgi:hypothetical protein
MRTIRSPATAADLVFLKLFAGGIQDELGIRLLVATPDGETIVRGVDAAVTALPGAAQNL